MEVSLWEDIKDADCIESDFLIEEVHLECGKEIIKKLKEEIKKFKRK